MTVLGHPDRWYDPPDVDPGYTVIVYRDGAEIHYEPNFDSLDGAVSAANELLSDPRYPWPSHAIVWREDDECERIEADPEWQHQSWPDRVEGELLSGAAVTSPGTEVKQ